jgi:ubiquinone/menaquinone biosynthesis C-methylase UbiE
LLGTDFSREMIEAARSLARRLDYAVPFRVADATALPFDDGLFDGAIFGFNGLMQIPGRARRVQALTEIRRVTRDGGSFVLTTHDREVGGTPGFWREENERWMNGTQNPRLGEFGDLLTDAGHGELFIHIPRREDIMEDLTKAGWTIRDHWLRSEFGDESAAVKAFSTDCRFWIAQNEITLADTIRTE